MFSNKKWKSPDPVYFSEIDKKLAKLTPQDYLPIPFLETCSILKSVIDQYPDLTYSEIENLYKDSMDNDPLNQYTIDELASYINYKTFDLLDLRVKILIESNIVHRLKAKRKIVEDRRKEIRILSALNKLSKQENIEYNLTDSEVKSNDPDQ